VARWRWSWGGSGRERRVMRSEGGGAKMVATTI
jgi:hypothetical protein